MNFSIQSRKIAVSLLACLSLSVYAVFGQSAESLLESELPVSLLSYSATLTEFCTDCHNDEDWAGSLTLNGLDLGHVSDNAEVWEAVIAKLNAGMMPPPGNPRPERAVVKSFISILAQSLDTSLDENAHFNLGSRTFARLSRDEYARSVYALLGLEVDVSALLPPDTMSGGFDNIADAQSFSPALMEGYLRAADRITTEALGDPSASATSVTYNIPSSQSQMSRVDGAPFGTRGGTSVIHNFPADGDYLFNVRLQAATNGGMIGSQAQNRKLR